jgi:hypothetical protein
MDLSMMNLGEELQAEVLAYAADHGLAVADALAALVRAGLAAGGAELPESSRLRGIERRLEDVWEALHALAPATLGVQRLIAHWATQSGSLRLSEDELLAELGAVARDEWAAALAARGLLPPVDVSQG